jgi:hypothetical protein
MRKFVGKLALAIALGLSSVLAVAVSAHATTTTNLFDPSWTPSNFGEHASLELGVRVTSSAAGYVTEIRYYKVVDSTAEHSAHVWDENGVLLASKTFTSETASGWQSVELDTPLAISAGQVFTVSVFSTDWYYPNVSFPSMTAGPITITNGYYNYVGSPYFPNQTVGKNYAVDFTFSDTLPTDEPSDDSSSTAEAQSNASASALPDTGRSADTVAFWAIGGAVAVTVGFAVVLGVPRRRRGL